MGFYIQIDYKLTFGLCLGIDTFQFAIEFECFMVMSQQTNSWLPVNQEDTGLAEQVHTANNFETLRPTTLHYELKLVLEDIELDTKASRITEIQRQEIRLLMTTYRFDP